MLKCGLLALFLLVLPFKADILPTAKAEDLPTAISCYQDSTNAKDIDAYMACFTPDAEMIDVSRTFTGHEAIRAWALREVISHGDTFRPAGSSRPPKAMPRPKSTG